MLSKPGCHAINIHPIAFVKRNKFGGKNLHIFTIGIAAKAKEQTHREVIRIAHKPEQHRQNSDVFKRHHHVSHVYNPRKREHQKNRKRQKASLVNNSTETCLFFFRYFKLGKRYAKHLLHDRHQEERHHGRLVNTAPLRRDFALARNAECKDLQDVHRQPE